MRVLSWFGVVGVALALGWGAASAVHHATDPARSLTAARASLGHPSAIVSDYNDNGAVVKQHVKPVPTPSPTLAPPAPPVATAPSRPAAPRPPAIVVNSTQQALINQDRARYGLGALTWSSCLYNVALSNAKRMAAQGFISHTNGPSADLSCGLGHQAGENVGDWSAGVNDSQLNTMFMNSPEHRANILGPYHYVATAWAVGANGYAYIAVEFG
ncbi:MAG TPA: CAP domain-containing protein [Candidatus Sulfotelmatobacter sp.]|nr:CAP domain-containing protein [Candidatus Sulfotelmatobacter sp.]